MCLGSDPTSALCPAIFAGFPGYYAACPSTLILNHPFDQIDPGTAQITTDLTLVPCSEDIASVAPPSTGGISGTPLTAVQLLIFNEFEQRFSASTSVRCFKEVLLSDIDSPGNEAFSIFNFAVQGTVVGQTRIRPVPGSETNRAHGLLGVAELFVAPPPIAGAFPRGSSAFNLNYAGVNPLKADVVTLP